ncbi:hypothetical protein GCM10027516_36910 [Niabella aquatica]
MAVYEVTNNSPVSQEGVKPPGYGNKYEAYVLRKSNSYLSYINLASGGIASTGKKGRVSQKISDNRSYGYNAITDTIEGAVFYNLDSNFLKRYNPRTGNCFCVFTASTDGSAVTLELLPETKEVLGLHCKRAVRYFTGSTGKKWVYAEIWYTNDIEWDNNGAGIEGIRNLPGFVVEADVKGTGRKWVLKEYNTNPNLTDNQLWLPQLDRPCKSSMEYSSPPLDSASPDKEKEKKRADILNQ